MFSSITSQEFLLLCAAFIAVYYIIIGLVFRMRNSQPLPDSKIRHPLLSSVSADNFELVGRPIVQSLHTMEMVIESEEDPNTMERIEDNDTILGREAEMVVEEIQETINHIATNPPNPEEVFTKISAIVRVYRIFQNTEYFEPINRFIALTVKRDCHLEWTEPELLALWN